jgi:hypothetical protein
MFLPEHHRATGYPILSRSLPKGGIPRTPNLRDFDSSRKCKTPHLSFRRSSLGLRNLLPLEASTSTRKQMAIQ